MEKLDPFFAQRMNKSRGFGMKREKYEKIPQLKKKNLLHKIFFEGKRIKIVLKFLT